MSSSPPSFFLRTLGGLSLIRRSDAERIAIGKPALALLCVLAIDGGEGATREQIAALIWPESDAVRARGSVKQALYEVRKAIGRDAVFESGPRLRLNSVVLECDATRFRSLVLRGDFAAAVSLYTGTFLHGDYVADSPVYDEWVDKTAQTLGELYRKSLDALALSAHDACEVETEISWLRTLLRLDPLRSPIVLRLAAALVRHGEPAAALAELSAHERALHDEIGLRPSAALEQMRQSIVRGEPIEIDAWPRSPTPARNAVKAQVSGVLRESLTSAEPTESRSTIVVAEPMRAPSGPPLRRRRRALLGAALLPLIALAIVRPLSLRARRTDNAIAILYFDGIHAVGSDPSLNGAARQLTSAADSVLGATGGLALLRMRAPSETEAQADSTPRYVLQGTLHLLAESPSKFVVQFRIGDLRQPILTADIKPDTDLVVAVDQSSSRLARTLTAVATALVVPWRYPAEGPVLGHQLPSSVADYQKFLDGQRAFDRTERPEAITLLRQASAADRSYQAPLVLAARVFEEMGDCDSVAAIVQSLDMTRIGPTDRIDALSRDAMCRVDMTALQTNAVEAGRLLGPRWGAERLAIAAAFANEMRRADSLLRVGLVPATRKNFFEHTEAYHALGKFDSAIKVLNDLAVPPDEQNEAWRLAALGEMQAAKGRCSQADSTLAALSLLNQSELDVGEALSNVAREFDVHGYPACAHPLRLAAIRNLRETILPEARPRTRLELSLTLLDADSISAAISSAAPVLKDERATSLELEVAHGVLGVAAARSGRIAQASAQDAWLARNAAPLEFGNATMWRARIAAARRRDSDASLLARKALSLGYRRWTVPNVDTQLPAHKIKEFTGIASKPSIDP